MPISDFLTTHAMTLGDVCDDVSRASWHRAFAADWGPRARSLAESANERYRLAGETRVQSDLGYLVAESSPTQNCEATIILLSANPGWVRELNVVERGLKGQALDDGPIAVDKYELYRTHFFPRWYDEVVAPINWQRGMWWNNAINFLHCVAGLAPTRKMCQLDPRLRVVGWELWPLHSAKDGLTAAARREPTLREFAKQSIRAALRTRADAVIVASVAGFELLEELRLEGLGEGSRGEIDGIKVRSWKGSLERPQAFAIRRQLFAGRSRPNGVVLHALAEFCGGRAASPVACVPVPVSRPTSNHSPRAPGRITLLPADGHGPLIWVRNVGGSETHGLDSLEDGASEEEVHRRIGGYWATPAHLGLAAEGSRGARIRDALHAGRRVFVLGLAGRAIVRVVEVSEEPYLPPAEEEFTGTVTARLASSQSPTLSWPTATSGRWGTEFETDIATSPRRVRLHTSTVSDEDWIGRELDGPQIGGRNPGFFTTEHQLPARLER